MESISSFFLRHWKKFFSIFFGIFLLFCLIWWGENGSYKADLSATNAVITSSCGTETKLGQSCTLKATKENTDITSTLTFKISGAVLGSISGNIFVGNTAGTISIYGEDSLGNKTAVFNLLLKENDFQVSSSCGTTLAIGKECALKATKDGVDVTTKVAFKILGQTENAELDPIVIALGGNSNKAVINGNLLVGGKEGIVTVFATDGTKESNTLNINIIDIVSPTIYAVKTLGNNRISYNTHENFEVRIVSSSPLAKVQNLEVLMVKGHITPEYGKIYVPNNTETAFVLKEYQDATPVKEQITASTGKNYSLLEIPVFIPEYDPTLDMPEGDYTFFVTLFDEYKEISQKTYYLQLGTNAGLFCDINGDSKESLVDGILTLKFVNKTLIPSVEEKKRADKNKNDSIDILDVLQILRCLNQKTAS